MATKPKKKTPYETLGVDASADQQTIKRVYRKRAKQSHPDCGGHADEFRELHRAYLLLTDERKRAAYERGEEESEAAVDNEEAMLANMLIGMFEKLASKFSHRLCERDVVADIRQMLESGLQEMDAERRRGQKEKETLTDLRARFVAADDETPNVFAAHILDKIRGIERRLAEIERSMELCKKAVVRSKSFRFNTRPPAGTTSTATTSSGWTTYTYLS